MSRINRAEGHEELHICTSLDLLNHQSDVEDSLCLPDAVVIFRDPVLCYDCLETRKMANENDDHIKVRCIDQNAREFAVQSMYGVKYDPHQLPAGCTLFSFPLHG